MFFQLVNPIPQEVKDKDAVREWLKKYNVIPYFGTAQEPSHAFQVLLRDLCELSNTYRIVMRARKKHTFGREMLVVERSLPGMLGDSPTVAPERQRRFVEALAKYGLSLRSINRMSRKVEEHLEQNGNAYLRVTRARVGEAVAYSYEVLHYLHTAYVNSKDVGELFLIHTPYLNDEAKLDKYPPDIYRVTRYDDEQLRWMDEGDGVESTVLHLTGDEEDGDEGELYNRPALISALTWLYIDFQTGNHVSKVAAAPFVVKKLLAMEAAAAGEQRYDKDGIPIDSFKENVAVVKELFTAVTTAGNRLGPKKGQTEVGLLEVPAGRKMPTAFDFEVNHDTPYLEYQTGTPERKIAALLGWDVTLTSLRQPNATLGGNLLYDTFAIVNEQTCKPRARYHEDVWHLVTSSIFAEEGEPEDLQVLGVEFPDTLTDLVDSMRSKAPSAVIPSVATAGSAPDNVDDDPQFPER